MPDGVHEVGLAQAYAPVEEEGVVHLGGLLGHRPGGRNRQLVVGAHHEALEGVALVQMGA